MQLRGRKAIVSGASRGIGASIARAFAQRGANAVLLGRDATTLETMRDSLECTGDQQHVYHAMDVSKSTEWDHLMKSIDSPDILVNVAGITHYSLLARTSTATIEDVTGINLLGAIYGSRAVSKSMLRKTSIEGSRGCIVNISSALAHRGGAGSTVYAASKAGMLGFTKALAEELGPRGIRTCAVCPGYIETDMVSGMSEDFRARIIRQTGLRRIGTVEEVALAVLSIVQNDFLNGTTITVDGGLTYE